jgi:hypothetical protein
MANQDDLSRLLESMANENTNSKSGQSKMNVGMVGFELAKQTEELKKIRESSVGSSYVSGSSFAEAQEMKLVDAEDSAFDSLVDRLRNTTFNVRLRDAMTDIVSPLVNSMKVMQLDQQAFMIQNDSLNKRYLGRIYEILYNQHKTTITYMGAIRMWFRDLQRHPIWRSIVGIGRALISTGKGLWKIMFGWGKKSVEEKILQAIKEQTEFQRTGKINREKGFFERFKEKGVIGGILSNSVGRFMEGVSENIEESIISGESV